MEESVSLEVFKSHVDVTLRDRVFVVTRQCWVNAWTHDIRDLLQTE